MKILAIETSTQSGSVALLEDEQLIAESTTCIKKTHAERLLPSIKSLLDSAHTKIEDIDGFALSNGPGSFTGLRIGLSTVKGFAWSLNKPVVGVSTLEALAMNLPYSDKQICPMLDARKKEVYAGIYKLKDARGAAQDTSKNLETGSVQLATCLMPDTAISPTALIERIREPTIFIGDGIRIISELKSEIANLSLQVSSRDRKSQIIFAPPHLWPIKAFNIGMLALQRFRRGETISPENIKLNYLRPSEAEVKLKRG